ncbi:MAG: ATP-binding protein [Candidatus Cloacimonetes bacterium]|nr:ATP-binding protein [Candidatus Cloacimonadota bacterium]
MTDRLRIMPVVVLSGARQTGKSTLAKAIDPERRSLSLDDLDTAELARHSPAQLLDLAPTLVLDEVQKEPGLLAAIKLHVDRDRQAGRFLLTGSANLLLMQQVSESLAGRASYLTLWPMTRREQAGLGRAGLWQELLDTPDSQWLDLLRSQPELPEDWKELARRGGFPTPALELNSSAEREIWFDGYVRSYLERDLQDLSSISSLADFRRLMRAAAHRTGQLLNQTELGRDVSLPQPTVHRWLNLLETSTLLVRLPAWSVNRTRRLIKSPKLYWADTGLALHLAGSPEPLGAHLENIVLHDLLAWRETALPRVDLFYWRTTTGDEVDFVIESGSRLLPIEIKSGTTPRVSDTKNLQTFRKEYEGEARTGLLIHTGEMLDWLTPGVLAVPWWRLL